MNPEDPQDRLVDLLLWELVGEETPPDVRAKVLAAATMQPQAPAVRRRPALRAVRTRPSKSRKAPVFAMAALLTLFGVVGILIHFQRISAARTPVLTAVSGTTSPPAGLIRPGESLSTGALSSAVLTYQDGTVVDLSPETTLVVTAGSPWDSSKGIELVAGRVDAMVAKQPPGSPMILTSKHARAEVVGTKLSFGLNDDLTRLEVTEGAVHFIPHQAGSPVTVRSGYFAESGQSGFRHEPINSTPVRGITRFTLMNAASDQPIRDEPLVDGETISLASLPTREINIRADFEGEPPTSATIRVTRDDGAATGLPPHTSEPHKYPPFFIAGDHWADGRPEDCLPWTPLPGVYRLSAEANYGQDRGTSSPPLDIEIRIAE